MLLKRTGRTSVFYLDYKEGLTEETGFPMVTEIRAKAPVVSGGDLTKEVTERPQSEIIVIVEEAASDRLLG
jgi:hypothetical protein